MAATSWKREGNWSVRAARATITVPPTLAPGRHRLGLWLPDADPRLRTAARVGAYSVRFANATWDAPINVLTDALQVGGP